MWILGHIALGYFSAYSVSKFTKEKIIIPLVWIFSLLPDLDELFEGYIVHRGPSHSILFVIIVFIPIFLIFRKYLAYFAALASHILVGDFFVPPTQMFWPLTYTWYGVPSLLQLKGAVETVVEVTLFVLMLLFILHRRRLFIDTPSTR
jgi:membrane-bound metal-dependent hydrolase YbcI (DUF457 family)